MWIPAPDKCAYPSIRKQIINYGNLKVENYITGTSVDGWASATKHPIGSKEGTKCNKEQK